MSEDKKQVKTLTGMSIIEMEHLVISLGEPAFRARQLYHWVYEKHVSTFDKMLTLPVSLRERLNQNAQIRSSRVAGKTGAPDGYTGKFLIELADGNQIEAVIMEEKKRHTICLSSQVGCSLGCTFCATATMNLVRNLTAGEMIEQFLHIQEAYPHRITNVVFMGMGEPFLNYSRVIEAAGFLSDPDGINLGARKITISTAGVIPRIRQFADEGQRYKLAVSLNGSNQNDRVKIMPVSESFSIQELVRAVRYYFRKVKKQVTFEYVLFSGYNDTRENARELTDLLGNIPCKVNIIPYNEIGGSFKRPSEEKVKQFLRYLEQAPFTVTVRWSRGTHIDAGCGQLVTRKIKEVS